MSGEDKGESLDLLEVMLDIIPLSHEWEKRLDDDLAGAEMGRLAVKFWDCAIGLVGEDLRSKGLIRGNRVLWRVETDVIINNWIEFIGDCRSKLSPTCQELVEAQRIVLQNNPEL